MKINLNNKTIMFLGIGGISMSAIARLCRYNGANITGVDKNDSEIIQALKKDNIAKIKIGHSPTMVNNADIVVYTNAIPCNDPDYILAKRLNKTIYERATMLGILSYGYKNVIAISGTHGKTTTTSLIGWIFECAEYHPTVHIGGISQNFGTNLHIGNKKYFITEACEYQKSFLHLNPDTTIINNIEWDHPDYYKSYQDIISAFKKLAKQTKENLIINGDMLDENDFDTPCIMTFGMRNTNDIYAQNIKTNAQNTTFDVYYAHSIMHISTSLLGMHNIYNIIGCIAIAKLYNIADNVIVDSIRTFSGTKRRFEYLYKQDYNIIIDYAHHPSEIRACIQSCRLITKDKLIVVFQPHTYSRTLALMKEFCTCFTGADQLYILPTYPAREQTIIGGRAIDLFYNITNVDTQYVSNPQSLIYTLGELKKNQTLLWIGAGDIENIAKEYVQTAIKKK